MSASNEYKSTSEKTPKQIYSCDIEKCPNYLNDLEYWMAKRSDECQHAKNDFFLSMQVYNNGKNLCSSQEFYFTHFHKPTNKQNIKKGAVLF